MMDSADPVEIERFAAQGLSVLITVSEAKGSTPRVAGTRMLVSAVGVLGTIGGGQLEYLAIDKARAMLGRDETLAALAVPLGPDIGQCCGGHVTLQFETVTAGRLTALMAQARQEQENLPFVGIFGAGHVGRALARAMQPLPVRALLIDTRREELALAPDGVATDLTAVPRPTFVPRPLGAPS